MRKNFIILFLVAALGACSMGKKPETVVYAIRPEVSVSQQSCKTKLALQITEPSVAPGLETRRIAVLQKNNRMDYYKNVRWTAPVSEMLQTAMMDGFEKIPAFSSVSAEGDDITPDLILTTDIRDFQVNEVKGKSYTQVRFVSKLISTKNHKIITTIPVESNITPSIHKIDDIIAAFEKGVGSGINKVITRSVTALPSCKKPS